MSKTLKIALIIIIFTNLSGCGGMFKPKKVDTRDVPQNAMERAKKNIKEGRGVSLGSLGKVVKLHMNLALQILCGELH